MAERRPLVLIGGEHQELPVGDTLAGGSTATPVSAQGGDASPGEHVELARLPVDDTGNSASILIEGRIGGWLTLNSASVQVLVMNRDGVEGAAVVLGPSAAALGVTDIEVRVQPDDSAIIYLLRDLYYTYDLRVREFGAEVTYTGTPVTPTGTVAWSLSTAAKLSVSHDGATDVESLILGGTEVTATATEINALTGITGNVQDQLDGKEPAVTAGTTADYLRGDKTWQALDRAAVGLANVDNTSDADKPISTDQQAALDDKVDVAAGHSPSTPWIGTQAEYDALGSYDDSTVYVVSG